MKLSVGSGEHGQLASECGFINLDRYVWDEWTHRADVQCDARALPFRDDSVERVYLGHVMEHLDYDDELPAMLAEVRRVLAPDGQLGVVGPCIRLACLTNEPDFILDAIALNIPPQGAITDDRPGLGHRWLPTAGRTRAALVAAGFAVTDVEPYDLIPATGWPNVSDARWQCAFTATV